MTRTHELTRRLSFFAALATAAALAAGCESGAPSGRDSAASPASLTAAEAPSASVTVALESDPPLPGTSDARWLGLNPAPSAKSPPADAGDHSHHHGGHHGH